MLILCTIFFQTMLADHIPFESCYQKLKDDPRFVEMSSSYVQPLILKRELQVRTFFLFLTALSSSFSCELKRGYSLQTYLFHLRAMCQLPDEEKKVNKNFSECFFKFTFLVSLVFGYIFLKNYYWDLPFLHNVFWSHWSSS